MRKFIGIVFSVFTALSIFCLVRAMATDAVPGAQAVLNLSSALGNPTVVVVASFLYELLCRLVPTQKASGILHTAAGILRVAAQGLTAVAEFTDKFLPQNTTNQPPTS